MHLTLTPANWECSWIFSGFSIWETATAAAWRPLGTVLLHESRIVRRLAHGT